MRVAGCHRKRFDAVEKKGALGVKQELARVAFLLEEFVACRDCAFPELVLLSQPARGERADETTDPKACQDGGNGGNRSDSGISQHREGHYASLHEMTTATAASDERLSDAAGRVTPQRRMIPAVSESEGEQVEANYRLDVPEAEQRRA